MPLTLRLLWKTAGVIAAIVAILPFQLAGAAGVHVLPPVIEADAHLGFCDVLPGSPSGSGSVPWAELAYDAGARVNRWEFRWDRIEPSRGQWSFSADDADVASSRQFDLAIDGVIDGIPKWAVATGQPRGNGVPRGLWRSPDDPKNLWATFLRGLVAHYRGEIGYWEIWNEPDLKFFWNGSSRDYARLVAVASAAIRETDPTARVMVAGMVVPDLLFARQVFGYLSAGSVGTAGGKTAFDLAAWHSYGSASALYTNLTHFKALLARDGYSSTPLWVSEDGFPAADPAGEPRQAAYVLQSIAYAIAAGASHVLVYRASDDSTPKQWGLLAADGSPRSGYVAFQLAAGYLGHSRAVVYDPSQRLERFVFYQADRRVILLWNRSAQDASFSLPAGHGTATSIDWLGNETSLTPADGAWKGTAPGATYNQGVDQQNSVVGGPPVLLTEDNTPVGSLPLTSYVSPVSGGHRMVVLLNAGDAAATAQITAAGNSTLRQSLEIAPHSLARVDLDLLAGPGFVGSYRVQSSSGLGTVAVSDTVTTPDVSPSTDWYLPSAPPEIRVTSLQAETAHVTLAAYNSRGQLVGQGVVTAPPGSSVQWSPAGSSRHIVLVAHADVPVVLGDRSGAAVAPAAAPATSWYALRPHNVPLSLFNPQSTTVHVNASFVGAPTVKAEELSLPAHHAYALASHNARAITLEATGGVVAGYPPGGSQPSPQAGTMTNAGLTAAGSDTHVDLLDPSTQPAHVSLNVITAKGSSTITRDLKPMQTVSVAARKSGGPPSGVVVSSDVPVVATAGP